MNCKCMKNRSKACSCLCEKCIILGMLISKKFLHSFRVKIVLKQTDGTDW